MNDIKGRRPLKTRDTSLARNIAKWLSQKDIAPNHISIASIGFAALAAIAFIAFPYAPQSIKWFIPLIAIIGIQGRLLCNLFDGMVAVEGGKKTASGELFNDVPDRIADCLIFIAAGYAITSIEWAPIAGWSAALFAVMTAYIRTLATSTTAPVDFRGPMAKQHRMALTTVACLITTVEQQGYILLATLVIIAIGSAITTYRRAAAAYRYLEENHHV